MKRTAPILCLALMACAAVGQRPELVPQTGHGDVIDHVTFSPDGRLIATAGGYTVKLWSPDTGRLLRTLQVKTLTPAMAFSPDSKILVVGEGMGAEVESSVLDQLHPTGDAYQIQFWDVKSGQLIRKVKGHAFWVSDIAFSPDGRWLATAGSEGEVLLRDAATGMVRTQIRGKVKSEHQVWPRLQFSADSSLLAFSDSDSDIHTVEVAHPEKIADLGVETKGGIALGFSTDSLSLLGYVPAAGGNAAGNLVQWDLITGKQKVLIAAVNGPIALSHDRTLAAAVEEVSNAKQIAFYTLRDGSKLDVSLPGYNILEFSPDGNLLVTSNPYVSTRGVVGGQESQNGSPEVILWRLKDAEPIRIPRFGLEDPGAEVVAYSVAVGDGGRLLARRIAGMTGGETLTLWDLNSNSGPELVRVPQAATANIALSRTGRRITMNVSGGVFSGALDGSDSKLLNPPPGSEAGAADVLAVSPNEELIARTGLMGKIKPLTIWNRASGNVLLNLTDVVGFAWLPDSAQFVSGDQEGRVQIRNSATGQAVKQLATQLKINAVAVSPDGSRIAAGGDDGLVHVWDTALGKQVAVLTGRECPAPAGATPDTITIKAVGECITSIAFSPDGRLLAASGLRKGAAISVWDAASGALMYSLTSTMDPTSSFESKIPFTFSVDGRFLIQGTRYITFWDLKTGREAALMASTAAGDWLVITPDGYFDGSPNGWKAIAWRFGDSTFDVLPVEAFYNEFYQPGLLSMIVAGSAPEPKLALEKRDRRQPTVGIVPTKIFDDTRHVSVALHVCQAEPDAAHPQGSGARDLRLFRNGSLVRHWSGDVLHGSACSDVSTVVAIPAGDNNLVAYAFNNDGIKSDDAQTTWDLPEIPGMAGTAYILAVGLNQYQAPGMDLRYARDDAQSFASQFAGNQTSLNNFSKVVTVSLLDDQATAAHIRAALSILSGARLPLSDADRELLSGLERTQPEDGVFLFYAGHGTAVGNRFYLLPHDLDPKLFAADPEGAHAISDLDLDQLFEKIDGRHFLVIVDACRSGQALEAEEKRQGAMNSRGLAQLAYEKGMYILTASQAYQPAMEAAQYGHGLLTYSLLDQISHPAVTNEDINLLDWLEEASKKVPALQRQFMEGSRGISIVENQEALPPGERNLQQPRLFYRRDPDPNPLVIVRAQSRPN
ncbi:MAG: caspase family protein [Terracidiphilus sp.]|jgi:WD40 repeat protein